METKKGDEIVYIGGELDYTKLTYGKTYVIVYSLKFNTDSYITLDGFNDIADAFLLRYFVTKPEYRKMKLEKLKTL